MTHVTQPTSDPSIPRRALQPALHDLASLVVAPALLLGDRDGQVRPGGVTGWYVGDLRVLERLEVEVAGSDLELVAADLGGTSVHSFSYVARGLGDPAPDPTVHLDRRRVLEPGRLEETLVVSSAAEAPVEVVLTVRLGCDLAPMSVVKQGGRGTTQVPEVVPGSTSSSLRWQDEQDAVEVDCPGAEVEVDAGHGSATLTWRCRLERGGSERLVVRGRAVVETLFEAGGPASWALAVEAADPLLRRTCEQSLADLGGLLLREGPDVFLAAGSPWFLTLFGRDSLWAARMLVPLDSGLALSTLRVLAARQGTAVDPATEEEPGKILHEVRRGGLDLGAQVLPPVYYGSIDATSLFVTTLADAHDWGADPEQVAALLPAARRCLEWVLSASAESGWLRYVDHSGHGLANQGWKDSHDSVQFADGRLAEPPIALAEVQAYAHEAAVRGAALLAAHGAEPVPGLLAWAEGLRSRFAEAFWVGGPDDGHVPIALDRDGRPADSLTSNLGHLLGTGILGERATARVGDLLADPRLDSGFGLRTLAADSPRFSRSSYHGGTVWPHDTAIAARGLAAEGRLDGAARLAAGVLTAAQGVDHRLPELYGGEAADAVRFPSAYPAACRPQAWAAAAPLAMLVAVTGVRADAPAGVLRHPARTSTRLGAFALRGLRVGEEAFDVVVEADGVVRVDLAPGSRLRVETTP